MLLPVGSCIRSSDGSSADRSCHLSSSFLSLHGFELGKHVILVENLSKELDFPVSDRHILRVVFSDGFPVDLLLQVREYLVTLSERRSNIKIRLSTLDSLNCLLQFDLSAVALGDLSLDKLLLLEMDDCTVLLANLEEFFDLQDSVLLLLFQFRLIGFELANLGLDIDDCLVGLADPVHFCTSLNLGTRSLLRWIRSILCLHAISHILCFLFE